MQHSGPNSPCPCCSRTKGDYCRWDDSQILCYRGQTLGPPDLRIGEVIKIDGVEWACVKNHAGFSGNSAMFIRHDESTKPTKPTSPADAQRQAVQALYAKAAFEQDLELAEWSRRLVDDMEEFHAMPPDRIRESLAVCRDSYALHTHLLSQCRRLRRQLPDIAPIAQSLADGLRAVRYQGTDLRRFWFDQLCDPADGRGRRLALEMQFLREEQA